MTTVNLIVEAAVNQLKAAEEIVANGAVDGGNYTKFGWRIQIADRYIAMLQHMPYVPPQTSQYANP